jgi:hypothetical protein
VPGAPPARVQRITVLAPTSNDPKRWSQIRLMALAVVAIWMLPAAVLCWLFSSPVPAAAGMFGALVHVFAIEINWARVRRRRRAEFWSGLSETTDLSERRCGSRFAALAVADRNKDPSPSRS